MFRLKNIFRMFLRVSELFSQVRLKLCHFPLVNETFLFSFVLVHVFPKLSISLTESQLVLPAFVASQTVTFKLNLPKSVWNMNYDLCYANKKTHVCEHSCSSVRVLMSILAHLGNLAQSYFSRISSAIPTNI